jgi:hypothetical protein
LQVLRIRPAAAFLPETSVTVASSRWVPFFRPAVFQVTEYTPFPRLSTPIGFPLCVNLTCLT